MDKAVIVTSNAVTVTSNVAAKHTIILVMMGMLCMSSAKCVEENPHLSYQFLSKNNERFLYRAVSAVGYSDIENIAILYDARCVLLTRPREFRGVRLISPSNPIIVSSDGRSSDQEGITPEERDRLEQELIIELLLQIKDTHKEKVDKKLADSEYKKARRAQRCKCFLGEAFCWSLGLALAGILPCVI